MHTPEHGLGRLAAPDERDRRFMLERPREAAGVEQRYWITRGAAYDQGTTSTCVAQAWCRWATTNPVVNKPFDIEPFYKECQQIDEWPGEDYDGTSVRAGAKALKSRGLISEYRWGFDAETIVAWLLAKGPVTIGVDWFWGFFYPNSKGFLEPEGEVAGGHAVALIGANRAKQAVRGINSWGTDWNASHRGRFWMSFETLDRLLKAGGEACTATEVRAHG